MQNHAHPAGTSSHPQAGPSSATQTWTPVGHAASQGSYPHQQATLSSPRVPASVRGATNLYGTNELNEMSDKYIPSSSDKITCTDHRPLDDIFGNPYAASGSPQTGSGPTRASRTHSQPWPHAAPSQSFLAQQQQALHYAGHAHHRPPPQGTPVLAYPLPTKPQLDGVTQIPLLAVDNQKSGTGLVVSFRCSDWGIGVQMEGIPMTDLLYHNARGLERPQEHVIDGFGLKVLRLNILWPDYPPFVKSVSASGKDGKPITRAGLGYEVAQAFADFFSQITSRSVQPTQPGPYTIALQGPRSGWSAGIRFEQLQLITVRNTSYGEWMAEVRAVLEV